VKKTIPIILYLILAFLITSCATGGEAVVTEETVPAEADKLYEGAGKDTSMLKAMNLAKMDAVRKAVIDMMGVGNEQANRDKLDDVLYNTSNPNAYIYKETFETTRKDKVGEEYIIECRVEVNIEAVESTLNAHGLLGGETVVAEE
jgi:hypothetical protein